MSATSLRLRPCTRVWVLLLALTTASVVLGNRAGGWTALAPLLLALAVLKGQLVVDHFMELRRVRRRWRALLYTYLLLVAALIGVAFMID
jgi:cytochrome c oxidase subunit IV